MSSDLSPGPPPDLPAGATRPRRPRPGGTRPEGAPAEAGRPASRGSSRAVSSVAPWPWLDRGGRVSPFKTAVFLATLLPGLIAGLRWSTGTLGAEPYLVGTALSVAVAQRLARRLCERCRTPIPYDPALLDRLEFPHDRSRPPSLYRANGCSVCAGTGYRGRLALHEVMVVTEEIEQMVVRRKIKRSE